MLCGKGDDSVCVCNACALITPSIVVSCCLDGGTKAPRGRDMSSVWKHLLFWFKKLESVSSLCFILSCSLSRRGRGHCFFCPHCSFCRWQTYRGLVVPGDCACGAAFVLCTHRNNTTHTSCAWPVWYCMHDSQMLGHAQTSKTATVGSRRQNACRDLSNLGKVVRSARHTDVPPLCERAVYAIRVLVYNMLQRAGRIWRAVWLVSLHVAAHGSMCMYSQNCCPTRWTTRKPDTC